MGAKTINIVKETGTNLHDLGLGKELLDIMPKRKN